MGRRRRGPGRLARTAVVLVALAACTTTPATPEEVLVRAVRDTFGAPFAYRVVAEADREALDGLGDQVGAVAARLRLLEISGVVDGDVGSLDVQVMGTAPVLQVRRFGPEETYVRLGLQDGPFASMATPELEGRLLGMAIQTGQPDAIVHAISALFDGDWVLLAGAFDTSLLTGDPGRDDGDDGPDVAVSDVIVEHLVVAEGVDDDGSTDVRVDLRVRDLLRTLTDLGGGVDASGADPELFEEGLALLPATVTGEVTVQDERVTRIRFDVARAAREDGVDFPGTLELRLEVSDHGAPPTPSVPDPTVTVSADQLAAGLQQLLQAPRPQEEASEPSGSGTASDAPVDSSGS